jgi:hypothetical protein
MSDGLRDTAGMRASWLGGPDKPQREWRFDRYRGKQKMAQGICVHAATEAEARERAQRLEPDFAEDTLVLRGGGK